MSDVRGRTKKGYIVLPEAARKTGYSSDYIGWLIRTGKIKGRKVYDGASLQTTREAILNYKKKKECLTSEVKQWVSLKEAAKISGYASDYIGWLIRTGKIDGRKIYTGISWQTTEETIRKYQRKRKGQEKILLNFPSYLKSIHLIPQGGDRVFGFTWRLSLTAFILFFLFSGFAPIKLLHGSLISAISASETKTINYYSTVSYGDWQNPENVQGLPEVGPAGDINSFNENNSAVYKTGPLQLIIEGFVAFDAAEDKKIDETSKTDEMEQASGAEEAEQIDEADETEEATGEEVEEVAEEEAEEEMEETDETKEAEEVEEETTEDLEETEAAEEMEEAGKAEERGEAEDAEFKKENEIGFFKKIRSFFGAGVLAQENIFSAKIKFSFAFGEKEPDILLEEPKSEDFELESGFWATFKSFVFYNAGKIKNIFGSLLARVASIAKAEEQENVDNTPEVPSVESQPEESTEEQFEGEGESVEESPEVPEEPAGGEGEGQEEEVEVEPSSDEEIITEATTTEEEIQKDTGVEPLQIEETLPNLDTRIIIWWSLDGINWQQLVTISDYPLSNFLNGEYFEYDAPFLKNWDDVKNLKIKFEGVVGGETEIIAYLDSVWVGVEYQEEKEEEEFELIALKKDWQAFEEPEFEIVEADKSGYQPGLTQKFFAAISSVFEEKPKVKAVLINSKNKESSLEKDEDFTAETRSPTKIKLFRPEDFRPGLHTLKVDFEKNGKVYNLEQDFTWGVLAINVNKSIYLPEEKAYLQMGVLDNGGHTLCDADLTLEITAPDGTKTVFTTEQRTENKEQEIVEESNSTEATSTVEEAPPEEIPIEEIPVEATSTQETSTTSEELSLPIEESTTTESTTTESTPTSTEEENPVLEIESTTTEETTSVIETPAPDTEGVGAGQATSTQEISTLEESSLPIEQTASTATTSEEQQEQPQEQPADNNEQQGNNTSTISFWDKLRNPFAILTAKAAENELTEGAPLSALVGVIEKSGECGPTTITNTPDYYAYYDVGGAGVYQIKLTAITENGTREITDSFEVRESVPFDVERIGPTRIWPPATYEMTLRIKTNQDFIGEVIEQVPESFEILDSRFQILDSKIIWQVDWKAGESYELKYQFDAPDVSPYLYLLGPLEFYE